LGGLGVGDLNQNIAMARLSFLAKASQVFSAKLSNAVSDSPHV